MYLGRGGSLSTAQELSAHCPKFLPENYGPTVVAAAQDSLLAVDADEPEVIYVYSTRYRGNEIAQNAFYNFRFSGAEVLSMAMWDNELYMINKRGTEFFVERVSLRYEDPDKYRLDRRVVLPVSFGAANDDPLNTEDPKFEGTAVNARYDSSTNETTIRIPYPDASLNTLVLDSGWDNQDKSILTASSVDASSGLYTDLTIKGQYVPSGSATVAVGSSYTMIVELSPQFLRDPENNPREGVLNLASMTTRHFQTGDYDIIIQRRDRPTEDITGAYEARDPSLRTYMTTFTASRSDLVLSDLPLDNIEYQGEMVSRIMGFADRTSIYIMSDYLTPVNITNIELKGKFKQTYSSIL